MTMPATARELGGRLPSRQERDAADQLRRILAAKVADSASTDFIIPLFEDGKRSEVVLTPALARLLMDLLRHVARGDAVTLVPVSQMLTTQQAADILNVSRPYLITLLEKGDLPHSMVGRHRRILANDLFEYKRARDEKRSAALEDLAVLDGELI